MLTYTQVSSMTSVQMHSLTTGQIGVLQV